MVTPRVLPPRPNIGGDDPKVSRARPGSGQSSGSHDARPSMQSKSSSSSISSGDDITKSRSTRKMSSEVSQSADVDAAVRKVWFRCHSYDI